MRWNKHLFLGVLFLCIYCSSYVHAQSIEIAYDVLYEKSKVGTLNVKRTRIEQNGAPGTAIEIVFHISFKEFFFRYSLYSEEHAVIGTQGLLVSYSCDSEENGNKRSIVGKLRNEIFSVDIQDGKKGFFLQLPQLRYDSTSWEIVKEKIRNDRNIFHVNILDTEIFRFEIERRTYEGQESLKLFNNTFSCQIMAFKNRKSTGKRWFAEDEVGPFLVREKGEDEDGYYSIIMTSYTKKRHRGKEFFYNKEN